MVALISGRTRVIGGIVELLTSCQFMNWVAPVDILCSLRSRCYPLSFCVCWVRMRVPEGGAIQTRKHSRGVHTWRLLGYRWSRLYGAHYRECLSPHSTLEVHQHLCSVLNSRFQLVGIVKAFFFIG